MGGTYSGTNARYLQPGLAIKLAYEQLQKNLYWLDILPTMETKTGSFIYNYRNFNYSGDAKKETAPLKSQSSRFTRVEMSRPLTASDLTESVGFEMALDRKSIQNPDYGPSTAVRAIQTLGYWISEQRNTANLQSMIDGANTSFTNFSPANEWSDTSAATPVQDLVDLASDFIKEGYPQRMTDVFLNKTNWDELNKYLINVDIGDIKQRALFGEPSMSWDDAITVPVAGGAKAHNVFSNITEGYILAIDARPGLVGAETHYYIDPEFSMQRTSYTTVVNGQTVTKPANNPGIHFHQYMEDDTHNIIVQMWQDAKTVVTQDEGISYGSGI